MIHKLIQKGCLLTSLLIGLFFSNTLFAQGATFAEDTVTIKTYPFSDPNPIPSLAINNTVSRFYPYFMFDGYTHQSIQKKWTVITLENPYIKVFILPEVGGKVWGAIEKSTGKEFVYLNHVMKFRAIGIRGPWTSGGIEHNFGLDLGHAPWTSSPVDYVLKKNSDGSVSCIVGGMDLASRTQWRVDIRLPEDKAYFETRSLWNNPKSLHDSYLAWENAAFKATDDLQFYFPGTHYIYHDGAAYPWPDGPEGRDLSLYKENNFGGSKSYHVMGTFTDWFGGYWHNDNFGFGHWSSYSDAPGKKIWIWPLSRKGAIWEDLLTDHDGQYIEAQSGVKINQAGERSGYHSPFTQLSLRPFYTDIKTDYWFPVKNTGGMADASPYGTMNIRHQKDSLTIEISPITAIDDSLVAHVGKRRVYSEFIHLKPMEDFKVSIQVQSFPGEITEVSLGKNKLHYSSDKKDRQTDRPVASPETRQAGSAEHIFRMAEDEASMRKYDDAMNDYKAVLQKDPIHSGALTRIAELYYRRGEYGKGLEYAIKPLAYDTYNPAANFIYGSLLKELGQLIKAEEAFSVASWSMEYRSAAFAQIANINIRKGNFEKAITYAKKAIDYNKYNLVAYHILGTGYRLSGDVVKAGETFDNLLEIDPLNHYARFEQYLLKSDAGNLAKFNSGVRSELPYETYLELAVTYFNMGLNREAIKVLEQAPSHPIVNYWLAYLEKDVSTQKSKHYLEQAESMSPKFVFPFRAETIPVLTWAKEELDSWKTNYYLGLIYWDMGRVEDAKKLFEQCTDMPDDAAFYITRGYIFGKDGNTHHNVEGDFKQAVKLDSESWRAWLYLVNYFLDKENFSEALDYADQAQKRFPNIPAIGLTYAKVLIYSGQNLQALKIMNNVDVLPEEHTREGHALFELANLSLSVENIQKNLYRKAIENLNNSKKWPENLGTGEPYQPDYRLQDYMISYCWMKLGNKKRAEEALKDVTDYAVWYDTWASEYFNSDDLPQNAANTYIGMKALRQTDREEKALDIFNRWKEKEDSLSYWRIVDGLDNDETNWIKEKIQNNPSAYEPIEKKLSTGDRPTKFALMMKFLEYMEWKN